MGCGGGGRWTVGGGRWRQSKAFVFVLSFLTSWLRCSGYILFYFPYFHLYFPFLSFFNPFLYLFLLARGGSRWGAIITLSYQRIFCFRGRCVIGGGANHRTVQIYISLTCTEIFETPFSCYGLVFNSGALGLIVIFLLFLLCKGPLGFLFPKKKSRNE